MSSISAPPLRLPRLGGSVSGSSPFPPPRPGLRNPPPLSLPPRRLGKSSSLPALPAPEPQPPVQEEVKWRPAPGPKPGPMHTELRGLSLLHRELETGVRLAFPHASPLSSFLSNLSLSLESLGFSSSETLVVSAFGRDDLKWGLVKSLRSRWDVVHDASSLGAVCTLGSFGLRQCLDHAPRRYANSRAKVVVLVAPTAACDQDGEVGMVYRRGQGGRSRSNGELQVAMERFRRGALQGGGGQEKRELDVADFEMDLLCERLGEQLLGGGPDSQPFLGLSGSSAPSSSFVSSSSFSSSPSSPSSSPSYLNGLDLLSCLRLSTARSRADYEELLARHVDTSKCDVAVVPFVHVYGQHHREGKPTDFKGLETEWAELADFGIIVKGGGEERGRGSNAGGGATPKTFRIECDEGTRYLTTREVHPR